MVGASQRQALGVGRLKHPREQSVRIAVWPAHPSTLRGAYDLAES